MSTTPQVKLAHGNPLMVDYTPEAAVNAGTVVVIGDIPFVSHNAIAADELGALAAGGGVYDGTADGALDPGERVFWDDTNNKFSATAGANKSFGFVVPDSEADEDGDTVRVVHSPGIALAGAGSGS